MHDYSIVIPIRILALWTIYILEMCLSNIKFEANIMPRSHSACTLAIDAAKSPNFMV